MEYGLQLVGVVLFSPGERTGSPHAQEDWAWSWACSPKSALQDFARTGGESFNFCDLNYSDFISRGCFSSSLERNGKVNVHLLICLLFHLGHVTRTYWRRLDQMFRQTTFLFSFCHRQLRSGDSGCSQLSFACDFGPTI